MLFPEKEDDDLVLFSQATPIEDEKRGNGESSSRVLSGNGQDVSVRAGVRVLCDITVSPPERFAVVGSGGLWNTWPMWVRG